MSIMGVDTQEALKTVSGTQEMCGKVSDLLGLLGDLCDLPEESQYQFGAHCAAHLSRQVSLTDDEGDA